MTVVKLYSGVKELQDLVKGVVDSRIKGVAVPSNDTAKILAEYGVPPEHIEYRREAVKDVRESTNIFIYEEGILISIFHREEPLVIGISDFGLAKKIREFLEK